MTLTKPKFMKNKIASRKSTSKHCRFHVKQKCHLKVRNSKYLNTDTHTDQFHQRFCNPLSANPKK